MSAMLLWNGELRSEATPVAEAHNRALRYGDGLFETMRVHGGHPLFFDAHWQRLTRTAKFLHIALPEGFGKAEVLQHVATLCAANGMTDARVRLQVFRDGAGTFTPNSGKGGWMMQCGPLPSSRFEMNTKGLTIGVYPNAPISPAPIGNHKTLNALPYVLAAIHAKEQRWDDALLMNVSGHVTETTSSNLFLIKGREVLTPDLAKGGLPGIMRSKVIEVARAKGFQVMVADISDKDMHGAEECILTNAIRGMQWVMAFGQKRYLHRQADVLLHEVNKLAGNQVVR